MEHSIAEIASYVFIDIAVIIIMARLFGRIAQALRQPAVVGEIVAGIALGPSLLGALPGDLDQKLFPQHVVPYLAVLAQLGLVLFMFIVGLELDFALIKGRERIAGTISFASIVVPFALGAALTLILYPRHDVVNGERVPLLALMLFIGVAMSITAFPVLARILSDRGMLRTTVGVLALASAAVDDILAWTLLAFVVAVVKGGSPLAVLRIVALTIAFAAVMFFVVRPMLVRLLGWYQKVGRLTPDILAVILVGVLASGFITDKIGIHSIFGAFLFGAALGGEGAKQMTHEILERLEQVSVLLLLPLFFVVTGFGVNIGGLSGSGVWQLILVLAVAIAGKFVGAFGGARIGGIGRQQSAALAILINTRGLTELVILQIGRQLGVLDGELFTMLVLMALVTTALTEPLLRLVYPDRAIERDIEAAARVSLGTEQAHRVLVAIDGPPDQDTDRLVQWAGAALGNRSPGEVLLARLLEAPWPGRTALEVGAGPLPDLAAMAEAVEELNLLAIAVRGPGTTARVLCRFSADPAPDLVTSVAVANVEVVVVSHDWATRNPDALNAFDGVVVLVVLRDRAATTAGWPPAEGRPAVAVTDGSAVLGITDGSADGNCAIAIAARAAVRAELPMVAVTSEDGQRARRRLAAALEPLRAAGLSAHVLPDGDAARTFEKAQAGAGYTVARVIDRTGGSDQSLRDVLTGIAGEGVGASQPPVG